MGFAHQFTATYKLPYSWPVVEPSRILPGSQRETQSPGDVVRYQRTNLQVHIATRLPKILFVSDEVWPGLVRPPGFEFPDHRLMVSRVVGLEAQWTLQAMS